MDDQQFVALRLHTSDIGRVWVPHSDWDETPDELREPQTRDVCLELIDWDRTPGSRYRIRRDLAGPD